MGVRIAPTLQAKCGVFRVVPPFREAELFVYYDEVPFYKPEFLHLIHLKCIEIRIFLRENCEKPSIC